MNKLPRIYQFSPIVHLNHEHNEQGNHLNNSFINAIFECVKYLHNDLMYLTCSRIPKANLNHRNMPGFLGS